MTPTSQMTSHCPDAFGYKGTTVAVISRSPVIIQISNGGAAFFAGKGIKNEKQKAAVLGSIAGAQHVRLMAKHYGIPVILHSDHCAKKLLDWFDGMLDADEAYFKVPGSRSNMKP